MTASKIKRLRIFYRILCQKEQTLAKELGITQQRLQKDQAQLNNLAGYQQEYERTFLSQIETDIFHLENTLRFIDHIGGIITQQQAQTQTLADHYERLKTHWIEINCKKQACEKYLHQLEQNLASILDRQRQKELDTFSNDKYARNNDRSDQDRLS